ncbi:MAG: right-handed parallel beta-helix repeat-containing protein, partial [Clostridiales Family XIII bacterium]|nr:right-handed parallel beta-helix repeat-containing protein [Clostridiales Family XIII bacterium]
PEGGVAAVKTPGDPAAKIVIKDAGLRGNSATNGGAVMNSVDLTATNVDFSNNTASGAGGAVNSRGDISTVITGCIFDGDKAANTTAGYGGAVSVFGGSLTIKDSSFTGDSAKYGGAASVDGDNDAIIENCIISDDSATNGGGIYSGHARLNIKNSVIESNNATKGGALYVYSNRKLALGVAIDGTSINGNSAKSTAGIYTDDINLIRANNSTFADNASDKGCQWSIANALADDPDYADALLHNANIVGTSYTSPYGNAYNNVDITYVTDKYLGEDENPGGEDEDTSGEDEDTGDGDTTGPAVEPATPIIPDEPDGPIAPDIVPNTPAPSGGPSGSPSGALTPALTPASMPAGSSVVSNTVYTAAATPAVGTAPMSMNLSDGNAPDEAVIGNQSVPFESSRDGVWSLINLIMTVVAAIMMIVSLMATARRRYDSFEVEAGDAWAPAVAEHGDWFDYRAGIEKQNRKRKLMKLLCIIPTAIISVMFVLMEDMSKPMGYMDKWTSLFLVVLLVQVATTLHIIAQTRAVRDNR